MSGKSKPLSRRSRKCVPPVLSWVVGGDYGISIAPHGTYAKDLEYFVTLFDMRPAEALLCATRNGGEAFDPSGSLGYFGEGFNR